MQAMREACKQLGKSKSEGREVRLASLSSRIGLTENFVRARVLITGGAHGEALALCNELLNTIPTDGQVSRRIVYVYNFLGDGLLLLSKVFPYSSHCGIFIIENKL